LKGKNCSDFVGPPSSFNYRVGGIEYDLDCLKLDHYSEEYKDFYEYWRE
jgi:hypothetical protein